ncbi:MAG: hypothetical protein IKI93_09145 [Clostridia bacterium]|nr:hypothetical protein [Clostridia bacterium]
MKLTYKVQLILSLILILLANILTEILYHWIYRSAGFILCGLLWIVHPVLPHGAEVSKRTLLWVRIAGILLILIGIFTRVHI